MLKKYDSTIIDSGVFENVKTDLSTESYSPEKNPWFSRPYAKQKRSGCYPSSPGQRA
jgi:hypothetical protein